MEESKHKSKKKRNLILTISIILAILLIAGISILILLPSQSKSRKTPVDMTADEVVTSVIKKMKYTNLSPISRENISRYYEIPDDTLSDYAMYISGSSGSEIEITCFVLSHEEDTDVMMKSVKQYLSSRNKNASEQNTSIAVVPYSTSTNFPYLFVAVAPDSDAAVSAFETLTKSA